MESWTTATFGMPQANTDMAGRQNHPTSESELNLLDPVAILSLMPLEAADERLEKRCAVMDG